MPHPLTGEFDAVVQVSGLTVNRLLASLHQNAYSGTTLPTLPAHSLTRIGDSWYVGAASGVRGKVRAQIGVPAMELIDRATHEVWVTAPIRAQFEADPATADFPEFIYGRVRAKYRISTVTSTGIRDRALTFLVLEVDPDSISFTSFGDPSADPQITEQARLVMARQMWVKPHPLVNDFMADHFLTLVGPGGETAVAHPLGTGSSPPVGDIESVRQLFLAGEDFAVAVTSSYVLSQVQPALDALKSAPPQTFTVTVRLFIFKVISATYTVTIETATAKWSALAAAPPGLDPVGVITLSISGAAATPSDAFPNATFDVTHDLWVLFDPVMETLSVVSGGAPVVSAHVNGPAGKLAEGTVENEVAKQYNAQLTSILSQATTKLQTAIDQKQKLIIQLQSLDAAANADFNAAESRGDGFVLRGFITLTVRYPVVVKLHKLQDDSGYTALSCWIPGGHIDTYGWRWYFTTAPVAGAAPPDGTASFDDRFVLQPSGPMPGLPIYDGSGNPPKVPWGQICLVYKGRVVDPVTGLERTVDNQSGPARQQQCLYVLPPPPTPPAPWTKGARRWWALWQVVTGKVSDALDEQVAGYFEARPRGGPTVNTLVHYLGDAAAAASLPALAAGLRAADRPDAGLVVAVVLREGLLRQHSPELRAALSAFAARVDTWPMVTEDVQGGWGTDLGVPPGHRGSAILLIDPSGARAWQSEGAVDAEALTAALREHLRPCAAPRPAPVQLPFRTGQPAPAVYLELAVDRWVELRALRGRPVILTFVQAWARPCIAQLRRLERLQSRDNPEPATAIAIVDGATSADARALARAHGLSFTVSADPEGEIARRFGIIVWPTTVTIDAGGRIADVEIGVDGGALDALTRAEAASGPAR
jgi:peroxiredoxin